MRKRLVAVIAATSLLAACSGSTDDGSTPGTDGEVSGSITVLTNRTDLVDTALPEYAAEFAKVYPGVTVSFEAVTDYEGEVKTRMNTKDYGDVLLIPNTIAQSDLPTFFEPLGTVAELSKTYRFIASEQAYEGNSYGIAVTGNAQGIVYNKAVWAKAGITEAPTTPSAFLADLAAVKASTDAIPLYTNYADGWPLTQWEGFRGTLSADPQAANALAETDTPWAAGQEHEVIDSLLWDAVEQGLTEPDPTTTNWEESKTLLGTGKVSAMVLGSWAIQQMRDAADNPDDIGYLPFPVQVDGAFHSTASGDYKNGVNINSTNKAAALAWVFWFADKSGYSTDNGGLTPRLDGAAPDTLADFEDLGVQYVELAPAEAGKESLVNDIDKQAEINLWSPDYRKRIVDAARGASGETKDEIFTDLDARWAAARAALAG